MPPHRGISPAKLRGHLALSDQGEASLTVAGERRALAPGRLLVFSDALLLEPRPMLAPLLPGRARAPEHAAGGNVAL